MAMGDTAGERLSVRSQFVVFLTTLLLFLWPVAVNGVPFYSDDSPSYLRGGAFGFSTGLLIIEQWWQSFAGAPAAVGPAVTDPSTMVEGAVQEANGVRSVIYSVATYLLRAPGITLIGLAIAQAGAVTLIVTLLRKVIAPRSSTLSAVVMAVGLAFLSSAAWYASYAVPDILAGVAIGGSALLAIFFQRLSLLERLLLVGLVALCITAHASHLPPAAAVLGAGGLWNLWHHRAQSSGVIGKLCWFASPVLLAVTALLATSQFAFGEASLAPKRYPITLARSVADGPGAWHLQKHCATERYAICEIYGTNPPRNVHDFLWGDNGVRLIATADQMERIRDEESTIIRRAAMEYPVQQFMQSSRNTVKQFFRFGVSRLPFGFAIEGTDDPYLVQTRPDRPELKELGGGMIYLGFAASVVLLIVIRRRLKPAEVAAIGVVVLGLLANAAVCGVLSAVTDRYQGRVAWLLPALAAVILLRLWSERTGRTLH